MNPRPIIKILTQQSSVKINNKKKLKKPVYDTIIVFFSTMYGSQDKY